MQTTSKPTREHDTGATPPRDGQHHRTETNDSGLWEVRIAWRHAPGVTWPPFSYAQKQTRQEAKAEAGRAVTFGNAAADLCAIATFIRAPGEAEWQEIARRQPVETSATTSAPR